MLSWLITKQRKPAEGSVGEKSTDTDQPLEPSCPTSQTPMIDLTEEEESESPVLHQSKRKAKLLAPHIVHKAAAMRKMRSIARSLVNAAAKDKTRPSALQLGTNPTAEPTNSPYPQFLWFQLEQARCPRATAWPFWHWRGTEFPPWENTPPG